MRVSLVFFAAALALLPRGAAAQESWADYFNPLYGYSIEYPAEGFSMSQSEKGLSLIEDRGRGQIDVYGAANVDLATPRDFEAVLRKADRIRRVTYSRGEQLGWQSLATIVARARFRTTSFSMQSSCSRTTFRIWLRSKSATPSMIGRNTLR